MVLTLRNDVSKFDDFTLLDVFVSLFDVVLSFLDVVLSFFNVVIQLLAEVKPVLFLDRFPCCICLE